MEVLVPGDGTIFSTCTLCEENMHKEHLGGKWSYCAARVANAKQSRKMADFLPFHNQILAFLCLQLGWGPVEHQFSCHPHAGDVTPTLGSALCAPSLVHSEKLNFLWKRSLGQMLVNTNVEKGGNFFWFSPLLPIMEVKYSLEKHHSWSEWNTIKADVLKCSREIA